MIISYLKERVTGSAQPKVSRAQVLASCPQRASAIDWERGVVDEDAPPVALLKIPRRTGRFPDLVARWFKLPDHRKLELDEIGSDVWEMCDGSNSVETITKKIVSAYQLNRRQAETSVTAYLRMLAQRRLIVLKTGKSGQSAKSGKTGAAKTARAAQRRQT